MPTEHKMEIVKIQLALNGPGPALIYARNRAKMTQQDLSDAVLAALGNDVKGYFEAVYDQENGWLIGSRVADQRW